MTNMDRLLLKASFCATFGETMLLPVWTALTTRVGGSLVDAGIGYALFSLVTGLVVMLGGRTQWYGRHLHSMVFLGFAINGIADVSYLFVHNTWQFFLVQCVVGLSIGLLNPAWESLYSDNIGTEQGAKKWSFWGGGISLIECAAAISGTLVLTYFGWNALFLSMGLVDSFAIYYSYQAYKKPGPDPAGSGSAAASPPDKSLLAS
jgi:hypothetical protein